MGDRAEDDVFQYVESFLKKHGLRSQPGIMTKIKEGILSAFRR
ncbi:hypothetical protein LEP1GSC133_1651 [Leptospira borgpetersenii serovar Pomona str. 200901868]|uniref:Uncharacterized protein n=4 Tax=Leptospira TaxID=171 RepID=M3FDU1_LEPBO|nr:hypothetical protein LEP1GSC123_4306 [Leptospira borgpetersenii str. 200701203]EMO11879.1 hypothetical protein LEP1GSC137_0889 [Leptospira borgpetersenii str. Noumea 25]EMO62584.1 hypothetical protein LEP1GSC133_1651 [Leptospira borgpetersenii serovar Pomona str. 200901868]EMY15392.1 hypothetical protein LEP1GSC043_1862 [Leptospira weilii str. Ecochallenge]